MKVISRTGLLASPTKKVQKVTKKQNLSLKAMISPAPYTLKPFAGLYNPYSHGCSLLCNHPANGDARKMIKKAKDCWGNEGKSVLLPEEVAAIRAELEQMHMKDSGSSQRLNVDHDYVESVPEELFKRYTEMDSRPLTPAPTLVSAHTRASAARRCVTPDPIHTSEVREKTLLVLDLRRSHSQETLSWYGSTLATDTPLIRVTHVGTRPPTPQQRQDKYRSPRGLLPLNLPRRPRSAKSQSPTKVHLEAPEASDAEDNESGDNDEVEEIVKRRGRRRKKRGRDSSSASVFRTNADPETLVATIGADSQNASARPSLVPNTAEELKQFAKSNSCRVNCFNVDSFLDHETLRQLRRELTEEIVEFEFNLQRRCALQEALKTVPKVRVDCEELRILQKEINLPVLDKELWLSLPRMFTRSSVRFELPMDSRTFINMTPLDYLKDNVNITSSRKSLYNFIFNIYKIQPDQDEEMPIEDVKPAEERKILGQNLPGALGAMMGGALTNAQLDFFRGLVGWSDEAEYNFKMFCGICGLCERVLAKEFYQKLPDRKLDPCNEIEIVDFESLERRLHNKTVDERLVKILRLIKEF